MNITITPDHVYTIVALLLMGLQVYQYRQLEKSKREIQRLWDQISTFNTMVALKLLETQQEIINLKENNNDGK
jgi:hypothetical protein